MAGSRPLIFPSPQLLAAPDRDDRPESYRATEQPDDASTLGHESPSAFATLFKRQFGQTPSQFFR